MVKKQNKSSKKKTTPEEKEMIKLQKELDESSKSGYGSPLPPETMLNFNTQLLYSGANWCVLRNNQGKAYAITERRGHIDVIPL